MPIRILFILKDTFPNGLCREVVNCAKYLRNVEIIVIAYRQYGSWTEYLKYLNIRIECCEAIKKSDLQATKELIYHIKKYKPDIVYTYLDSALAMEMLCGLKPKIRIFKAEGRKIMEKNENRIKLYRDYQNEIDLIIVSSDSMRRRFAEIGLDSSKCYVLETSVETNSFIPPKNKMREKKRMGFTGIICCNVSRIVPHKRLDKFIQVAESVKSIEASIHFVWVGKKNNYTNELNDISSDIQLLGEQIDPLPYYQASDIFLMTSENESAPNSILEAMSCGLPIITTKSFDNIEDYVIPGAGMVLSTNTEIASSIIEMSNHNELIMDMGKLARNHVINNYDISYRINKLKQIIYQ